MATNNIWTTCSTVHLIILTGTLFTTLAVGTFAQSCNFQNGFCGWNTSGSGLHWQTARNPDTSDAVPSSYAYVVIISNTSGSALLTSPEETSAITATIELKFQYRGQLNESSRLSVNLSTNGGEFEEVWRCNARTPLWTEESLLLIKRGVTSFRVLFQANIGDMSQNASIQIAGITFTVSHDDCSSSPCLNGGICYSGETTITCICRNGYQGENCQISPDLRLANLPQAQAATTSSYVTGIETITVTTDPYIVTTNIPTEELTTEMWRNTGIATKGMPDGTNPTQMPSTGGFSSLSSVVTDMLTDIAFTSGPITTSSTDNPSSSDLVTSKNSQTDITQSFTSVETETMLVITDISNVPSEQSTIIVFETETSTKTDYTDTSITTSSSASPSSFDLVTSPNQQTHITELLTSEEIKTTLVTNGVTFISSEPPTVTPESTTTEALDATLLTESSTVPVTGTNLPTSTREDTLPTQSATTKIQTTLPFDEVTATAMVTELASSSREITTQSLPTATQTVTDIITSITGKVTPISESPQTTDALVTTTAPTMSLLTSKTQSTTTSSPTSVVTTTEAEHTTIIPGTGVNVPLVVGLSIGGFIILVVIVALIILYRRSSRHSYHVEDDYITNDFAMEYVHKNGSASVKNEVWNPTYTMNPHIAEEFAQDYVNRTRPPKDTTEDYSTIEDTIAELND